MTVTRHLVAALAGVLSLGALAPGAAAQWDPANGDWDKSNPDHLRVMTWNVEDNFRYEINKLVPATFSAWDAIVRKIAAMKPDVLILQECGDGVGGVDSVGELLIAADLLLNGGPDPSGFTPGGVATSYVKLYLPPGDSFDLPHVFISTDTDGFNRNVILSRFPFTDLNGDFVSQYSNIPSISSAGTYACGGDGGIRGFQFAEIDLPDGVYPGDVVVGNAHLKSGGDSNDRFQRLCAAQNVAYFIDAFYNGLGTATVDPDLKISGDQSGMSVLPPETPVIYGGDWNEDESTNGRKGPAEWLTEAEFSDPASDGVDRDRSDAEYDAAARVFSGTTGTLGGSKLDYIAWQDSVAVEIRSFIFDSADLPFTAYPSPAFDSGFSMSSLSAFAADHRPVIVDFELPTGPGAVGACCFENAGQYTCLGDQTGAECIGAGGVYLGAGSDCVGDPCTPRGACCIGPIGSQVCVADQTEAECDTAGGTYQGDNTDCGPGACPIPDGACCLDNNGSPICQVNTTEADCLNAGGTYLGDGSNCGGDPCTPATGVCCVFYCNGQVPSVCLDGSTEADCLASGGTYMGDDSICSQVNCSFVCRGDLNGDGDTLLADFSIFSANFGLMVPVGTGGDLNCDGEVLLSDFSIFAADFGCETP